MAVPVSMAGRPAWWILISKASGVLCPGVTNAALITFSVFGAAAVPLGGKKKKRICQNQWGRVAGPLYEGGAVFFSGAARFGSLRALKTLDPKEAERAGLGRSQSLGKKPCFAGAKGLAGPLIASRPDFRAGPVLIEARALAAATSADRNVKGRVREIRMGSAARFRRTATNGRRGSTSRRTKAGDRGAI